MRILLDENDIQTALDAYVKTLNFPNAATATVDLQVTDEGDIEAEVVMDGVKPKSKGGRPRGSKNKTTTAKKPAPKEEEENVVETGEDDSEGSSDDADSGGDQPSKDDSSDGEKEAPKGGKGNLFGDSEGKASSDSPTTTEGEAPKEETGTSKVKTKKSSIFDVD